MEVKNEVNSSLYTYKYLRYVVTYHGYGIYNVYILTRETRRIREAIIRITFRTIGDAKERQGIAIEIVAP